MVSEWDMPGRSECCAACGHHFAPGEVLRASLCESARGYERRDYCAQCPLPDQPAPVASWKTRRPEPTTGKARSFDHESVYRLFERLEEADAPDKQRLRFVLALLLWRKKVLRFERSETRGAAEVWHFAVPRDNRTHAVPRPDLDEQQLEQLEQQLEQLLAGAPQAGPAPATSAGPQNHEPGAEMPERLRSPAHEVSHDT